MGQLPDLIIDGRDHASLALMPLAMATPPETSSVSYSYQVRIDERIRRVDVTLSAAAAGWPTADDQIVFLALLQLGVKRGQHDLLRFDRGEAFSLLGWSDAGTNYDRFRAALQRLTGMMILVHSEMVGRNGRAYSRQTSGVHVIDSFHIATGYAAECQVKWGQLVMEAFALDDLKRLDWPTIRALGNPISVQLYRLIDRATLAGSGLWEVGWRTLALALGMKTPAKPGRFREIMAPHCQRLVDQRVIDNWEYQRGGTFRFIAPCYLRAQLRAVLERFGVYPEAARQLVAGYDELGIICQCDCHHLRDRAAGAGHLVEAIRGGWALRYPDDEAAAFGGLWSLLSSGEREAHQAAAMRLLGSGADLFATRPDPSAWPREQRAVVRCMVTNGIDPERI